MYRNDDGNKDFCLPKGLQRLPAICIRCRSEIAFFRRLCRLQKRILAHLFFF